MESTALCTTVQLLVVEFLLLIQVLSFNGTNYFINNVAVTTGGTYSGGAIAVTTYGSSDPLHIISCENNLPDCSKSEYTFPRTVYPGETFQVSVVAVGQRNAAVPSTVISIINQEFHPGLLPVYQLTCATGKQDLYQTQLHHAFTVSK